MKKGSTAAVTASRNISQQKLTIGLDLGDRHNPCRVSLDKERDGSVKGAVACLKVRKWLGR
jgi:hypothetical protein